MSNGHLISLRVVFFILCVVGALTGTVLASQVSSTGMAQNGEETVLFRQGEAGYTGCADTRIAEGRPDTNFSEGELILGEKGRIATLIRFDVSSIPGNAIILEATLGLYVANYGQRTEPSIAAAYAVFRHWQETEATWNKATTSDYWGSPGCSSTTSDRSATPLDHESLFERGQWHTWSVASAVQDWVQDPASNKGLFLQQTNTEVGGEYDIRQSEYGGLEFRPYLLLRYTLRPPTPTAPPTPQPLPCVGTPEPGALLAVLQEGVGYSGTEDTMLNFDDRATSYSGEWFMRVGYRQHYSGLIKYDVSSIPQGSRIICAALSLFAERWSGGPLDLGAYYVKRENVADEATWTRATSLVPWQEGGCNGPDDRLQTPESLVTMHGIYRWYHLELTRVVAGWVNGGLPNNGVSLQAVNRLDDDTVWFAASDDATVANRPKLVILYVPPSGPTPTETTTPTPTATLPPAGTMATFQDGLVGYVGCSDTRISAGTPDSNFAASDLQVGEGQELTTLVKFDLSSIPAAAIVESAVLHVYGYDLAGTGNFDVGAYAVRRYWAEEEATWSVEISAVPWGLPGCNSTFSDRAEVASDQAAASSSGWNTWAVTDDVQRMVSDPGTNEGWLLRQTADVSGVLSMYSSEHETVAHRPKLVVTYSLP